MHPFLWALAGGGLIGLSASLQLLFNGRIAGISGIAGGLFAPSRGESPWRVAFLAGLVGGGLILRIQAPQLLLSTTLPSASTLALSGVLVGFGTRLGSGCTSGHGVCGLSRGSARSLVATLCFMGAAALTVFLTHRVPGGTP